MGGSSRDAPSFLFGLGLDLPTDSGAWLFLHVAAVLLSPDGTLNRPGFGGGSGVSWVPRSRDFVVLMPR